MFLFTRCDGCGAGASSPASRTRVSDPHDLVRNHSLNFGRVCVADQSRGPELALSLLVFGRQNVAQKRLRAFYFPGSRLLEAFGGALVCF